MDQKLLRYHPERYKRTRKHAADILAIYESWDPDKFPELSELEYKQEKIIEAMRRYYPTPVKNPVEIMLGEMSLGQAYGDYCLHGNNIFHLTPSLVEEFRQTDVGGIPIGTIKLPYNCFYVSFGPQEDLVLGDGVYVDGAYITIYEDDQELSILMTGKHADIEDLTRINWQEAPDYYPHTTLGMRNPEAEIDKLAEAALHSNSTLAELLPGVLHPTFQAKYSVPAFQNEIQSGYPAFREALNIAINAICYITAYQADIELAEDTETAELQAKLGSVKSRRSKRRINAKLNEIGYTKIRYCGLDIERTRAAVKTQKGMEKRTHWRRGHWRHQRWSKGNEKIRLKWIRPVLVRKDLGKPETGHIYIEMQPPTDSQTT